MFEKNKPIFSALSPNTEIDDVLLALKLIFKPWVWKNGDSIERIENKFKKHFKTRYASSFNSGRSAFFAILKSLELKEEDEIFIQAFTCNAVVNPILKLNLKPVFIDCDESFNLNPEELERKITEKTKVVVTQHTFGQPAKLDRISEICRKHNLILIEDCAHSLGAKYKDKEIGTFGKASFFSFGRDKVISSVYGGMTITNDQELGEKIRSFQEEYIFPSNTWILQQLLHPVLTNYIIKPFYYFPFLGKLVINFFQIFNILSKSVYKEEKRGKLPSCFPRKLPNALAILTINQFDKLERFNNHRKEIAKLYIKNIKNVIFQESSETRIFFKFPILTSNTNKILKEGRKKRIFLNDGWRKSIVVPPDTNIQKMKYIEHDCPKAEEIADHIINLPTNINISKKKALKIINSLSV